MENKLVYLLFFFPFYVKLILKILKHTAEKIRLIRKLKYQKGNCRSTSSSHLWNVAVRLSNRLRELNEKNPKRVGLTASDSYRCTHEH